MCPKRFVAVPPAESIRNAWLAKRTIWPLSSNSLCTAQLVVPRRAPLASVGKKAGCVRAVD